MSRSNKSANSHHSGGSNSSSSRVPQQHVTTTLHSIESHGSVGTNRGTGAYFHQSAAERKLELLESRVFPVGHSPLTATSESTSFQPSFSQSPHTHSQQQQRQQRHLKPFHSFGFDSPTMDLPATHGGSTHQGALLLRTRSKRGLLTTSTLDQVRLATDRHLQKVAAAAATTTTDPHGLVVASSSCSEVSSESSTRLLHNRSTGREPPPQQPPVQTEEQQQEDQPMLQQQQQALSSTTEPQSTNGGVATIAAEGDQTPSLRTPPVVEPTVRSQTKSLSAHVWLVFFSSPPLGSLLLYTEEAQVRSGQGRRAIRQGKCATHWDHYESEQCLASCSTARLGHESNQPTQSLQEHSQTNTQKGTPTKQHYDDNNNHSNNNTLILGGGRDQGGGNGAPLQPRSTTTRDDQTSCFHSRYTPTTVSQKVSDTTIGQCESRRGGFQKGSAPLDHATTSTSSSNLVRFLSLHHSSETTQSLQPGQGGEHTFSQVGTSGRR